jgi:hypothetical protein
LWQATPDTKYMSDAFQQVTYFTQLLQKGGSVGARSGSRFVYGLERNDILVGVASLVEFLGQGVVSPKAAGSLLSLRKAPVVDTYVNQIREVEEGEILPLVASAVQFGAVTTPN